MLDITSGHCAKLQLLENFTIDRQQRRTLGNFAPPHFVIFSDTYKMLELVGRSRNGFKSRRGRQIFRSTLSRLFIRAALPLTYVASTPRLSNPVSADGRKGILGLRCSNLTVSRYIRRVSLRESGVRIVFTFSSPRRGHYEDNHEKRNTVHLDCAPPTGGISARIEGIAIGNFS
jgi:hypothetical protein